MRHASRIALVAAALAIAALPPALSAQSRGIVKQAQKLLARLKLVDGAGSGLDADTVRGIAPLVVRDANGALVGTVVVPSAPISVARVVAGRAMVLAVVPEGFVDTTCPLLCYESADCTGTPYRDAADALLPFVSVCGPTAYYPSGPVGSHTIGSCRTDPDPCTPVPATSFAATTVATFSVADLGLLPPFHVEGP
jgi:hypothetical protein